MKRSYYFKLRLRLQSAIPGVLTVVLLIIGAANSQLPGIPEFIPSFTVMAIFFWVIYAPRFMPQGLSFLLGILQDALNGAILGQSAVINLILWGVIYSQRRFLIKESFIVLYGIFAITSLFCSILAWLIFSLVSGQFLFAPSIVIQWLFTIGCYPLVHWIFSNIYLAMVKNFRYSGWR